MRGSSRKPLMAVCRLISISRLRPPVAAKPGSLRPPCTANAPLAAVRATLLERLGMLYRNTEQFTEAAAAFKQAADLDTDEAPRLEVLIVDTYRAAKDLPSAEREADAAMKKFPNDHAMRADLLSGMGKTDEAVAEVKANAKGELDREAQLQIAEIYEKGKRWADIDR